MPQTHPSSQKGPQLNQMTPQKRNIVSLDLSSNVFYSLFLSVAMLMTGLLYSTGMREMPLPQMTLPNRQAIMEEKMHTLVTGYPIDEMAPYIAKQNKTTAAFLIGIAKKESNWGKRVPRSDDGADCYNYWGYRGAGSRGTAMGHGCFGSREEAVSVVGKRLNTLATEYEFDTPEELIVWKCGWSCDGHSNASVKKWISDVGIYYKKMKN